MTSGFRFGSKAETLERLGALVRRSRVPDLYYVSLRAWRAAPDRVVSRIAERFGERVVAIRSSAVAEDGADTAMAGAFESVLGVPASSREALLESITHVAGSLAGDDADGDDQILIQEMVCQVSVSGVVFTQEMKTGSPYYVVNYDDLSGRTDTVTSGGTHSARTLFVFREATGELRSERFSALMAAVREIEAITGSNTLDIEFAVDEDFLVHLLQVRRITTSVNWNREITLRIGDRIRRIRRFVRDRYQPRPGWFGRRSIFAQMPDWNPVEMIGAAPRRLALSLYRYLITDSSWRIARRQMGYAEPVGAPLMVSLGGKPFIDVRLSFHSYLPAGLEPALAHTLVDAWLDRLAAHPELHDKVEFEVATTCLGFDLDGALERTIPGVLTDDHREAFRAALRAMTADLLEGRVAPIAGELARIERLRCRREALRSSGAEPALGMAGALLEDAIHLGTIPFSILARHAFIAKTLLDDLVRLGALSVESAGALQRATRTVASDLVDDFGRVASGEADMAEFLRRYGHLRPGTYDILSLRYDQREDLLRELPAPGAHRQPQMRFAFTPEQTRAVAALCRETGFDLGAEQLLAYVQQAVVGREYAKFEFTHNVSDALEVIAGWGERNGLSREELSFVGIRDLLDADVVADGETPEHHLRALSRAGRDEHEVTSALRLPYLIDDESDVVIAPLLIARPNFVTLKSVKAPIVHLDGHGSRPPDLTGKIVVIESADPGFDWIFSRAIAGLLTKFGGANSHMAIRCVEFDLPAAIGCGEQIYDRVLRARAVEINCAEERVLPL